MTEKLVTPKQNTDVIEKQPAVFVEILTDGVYEQREYQGEKRDCWVQESDVYLGGRYPVELDITVYDQSKLLEKGFYKLPLDDFIQVSDKKRLVVQDKFSIARKLQKSMNQLPVCTGALTANADGTISCSGSWVAQAAPVPFDPTAIDPAVATALFAGGFALIVAPWAAAFGGRMLLKAIKSY